jgi:hypothetical protein
MKITGQSEEAQRQRLAAGCCPFHGHQLILQTTYLLDRTVQRTWVCPRLHCLVKIKNLPGDQHE